MLSKDDKLFIIMDYEKILTGEKGMFSVFNPEVFEKGKQPEIVGVIWRYAITRILRWNYAYAKENFTRKELLMLKLDRTLEGTGLNKEVQNARSYLPILALAFPEKVNFSEKTKAIEIYRNLMKVRDAGDTVKFPHGFFTSEAGIQHACDIFNYCIEDILPEMETEELYEFFASPEGRKWISINGLDAPCSLIYHNDPVEYLYNAVPVRYKDDALFNKYERKGKKPLSS